MTEADHEAFRNDLLIVTGLSGAGMSSVLKILEDLGYEVFDNFPLPLVESLLAEEQTPARPVAIGIDTRARGFDPGKLAEISQKLKARLIFMTCDDAILQKRFTQTRRRHPLAGEKSVRSGIRKEHEILQTLEAEADVTIDTTELGLQDLRQKLKGLFDLEDTSRLTLNLMSFGFRYGPPREADIVMDVRFLQNPHWVPALKDKTGKNEEVGAYIREDPAFPAFMEHFKNLLDTVLPRHAHEGKSYLTVAIGCTGGRHRSVYIVETLKPWLAEKGFYTHMEHRDLEK
ncbi:MAG: RNase adapter RapZ [Alphaproteobacteria bacterium]|nr:RNase adapter RapZ [Alphaproteobacteria bacterium]